MLHLIFAATMARIAQHSNRFFTARYKRDTHGVVIAPALVCLGVLLSACLGQSTAPDDHYYRLPRPHGAKNEATGINVGEITVEKFAAEGVYRERAILYSDLKLPLEIKLYHYRYWSLPPEMLLQDHLIDCLRDANPTWQVTRYENKQNPNLLIQGKILRFERVLADQSVNVAVTLELRVSRFIDTESSPYSKVYQTTASAADADFHATIAAFGSAVNEIYGLFISDLARY